MQIFFPKCNQLRELGFRGSFFLISFSFPEERPNSQLLNHSQGASSCHFFIFPDKIKNPTQGRFLQGEDWKGHSDSAGTNTNSLGPFPFQNPVFKQIQRFLITEKSRLRGQKAEINRGLSPMLQQLPQLLSRDCNSM